MFYVTLTAARTFGQTGAGFHASVGCTPVGTAATAAITGATSMHQSPHLIHPYLAGPLVASGDAIDICQRAGLAYSHDEDGVIHATAPNGIVVRIVANDDDTYTARTANGTYIVRSDSAMCAAFGARRWANRQRKE